MTVSELIDMAKARKVSPADVAAVVERMAAAEAKHEAKEAAGREHEFLSRTYSI